MLRLMELALPLRRSFETASATLDERRTLLVGVDRDGETGWAEAAPFPGQGPGAIDVLWHTLTAGSRDELEQLPTVANAIADRSARLRSVPLWRELGGSRRPIGTRIAIGATSDALQRVTDAVSTGYRAVKLKIGPGFGVANVRSVRERFPELEIGVDGNGSYPADSEAELLELDQLGVAYIEQPYPAGALDAHRALRDRIQAPVVLDESVQSVEDAVIVMRAAAADVLVVKPGRLGFGACATIHDLAVDAGLQVKPSGLIETGIGRAFTLALATLPGSAFPDLVPADAFLEVDPVTPPMSMIGGDIVPSVRAGIGCEPDDALTEPFVVRAVDVPFDGEPGPSGNDRTAARPQ